MIAVEDPDAVLERLWQELRAAPELADLVAVVPPGKSLGIGEAIAMLTIVLTTPVLQGADRQLAVADALARAHARARGWQITEER